jgi:hypothetical protein
MGHDQSNGDSTSHNQILNFLDIDLNSFIANPNHMSPHNHASNAIMNASSNFLSSSNPNLVYSNDINNNVSNFDSGEFAPGNFSLYSSDPSKFVESATSTPTASYNEQQHHQHATEMHSNVSQLNHQHSYHHHLLNNQSHNQYQQKPPGSKILPLLSNKSAPIRLTTSTSCSYLEHFYQQQPHLANTSLSSNNNGALFHPGGHHSHAINPYQTKSHLAQAYSSSSSSMNCLAPPSMHVGNNSTHHQHHASTEQVVHSQQQPHHHINSIDEYSSHGNVSGDVKDENNFSFVDSVCQQTVDLSEIGNDSNDAIGHQQQTQADSLFQMEDFNLVATPTPCQIEADESQPSIQIGQHDSYESKK